MTKKEQNDYYRMWHKFQQRYEKLYEKKFAKALDIQVKAFIKTRDVMAIPSFPIYTVLVDMYKTVGPRWVRLSKMSMTKATGSMGFNERIVELMRQYYGIDLLNDAEAITAYTKEVIGKILSDAAMTGASYDDIVKSIMANSELGAMRARRIARTETVTASNGAAMIYAQTSGNKLNKIWIAVRDKRTRDSHRNIDGRIIPIEDPFILGKYADLKMMQPGVRKQPNGLSVPASEVVNCRCVVAFMAKRDAQGRIIRS